MKLARRIKTLPAFYIGFPQLGQVFSAFVTMYPQFLQVMGWISPKGAPQAMQLASPGGLAVLQ